MRMIVHIFDLLILRVSAVWGRYLFVFIVCLIYYIAPAIGEGSGPCLSPDRHQSPNTRPRCLGRLSRSPVAGGRYEGISDQGACSVRPAGLPGVSQPVNPLQ